MPLVLTLKRGPIGIHEKLKDNGTSTCILSHIYLSEDSQSEIERASIPCYAELVREAYTDMADNKPVPHITPCLIYITERVIRDYEDSKDSKEDHVYHKVEITFRISTSKVYELNPNT